MTTRARPSTRWKKSGHHNPYGRSGDAIQQALKEWYEFQESYDPDYLLATNEPDIPGIPNQYEYTYSCYTQEMVDKVDEIAAKYNLKLLDEWIPFQRYQSDIFLEETGIQSLLLPDSGAQITGMAGMLYPPYNFSMEFNLVTENAGTLMTSYGYARKDYFPVRSPAEWTSMPMSSGITPLRAARSCCWH